MSLTRFHVAAGARVAPRGSAAAASRVLSAARRPEGRRGAAGAGGRRGRGRGPLPPGRRARGFRGAWRHPDQRAPSSESPLEPCSELMKMDSTACVLSSISSPIQKLNDLKREVRRNGFAELQRVSTRCLTKKLRSFSAGIMGELKMTAPTLCLTTNGTD